MSPPADRYRAQEILTATPCQLVVKLYDGAIASLQQAQSAIARRDIKSRHNANRKALDIITHLTNTLDMERGGEIARNLSQLYDFMCTRLIDVDVNNDPKAASDVIALLTPLRSAWQELDTRFAGARAAPARPVAAIPQGAPSPPAARPGSPPRVFASA
jgi:flagellar protein FliS